MAVNIVKDSGNGLLVKKAKLLASGGDVSTLPAIGAIVVDGAVVGVLGDTPYKGEDGAYYGSVDTGACIRINAITGAYTANAPVYLTPGKAPSTSASGNTLIGFAERDKGAASGPLFVQLVPKAA